MSTTRRITWPLVQRNRYGKVTIYRQPRNGDYLFTIAYRLGSRRIRETRKDFDDALDRAAQVLAAFEKGETPQPATKSVDKWKHVLKGTKLEDVLRFYAQHHNLMPSVSAVTVTEEFVAVKRRDPIQKDTLATIKYHVGKFADYFRNKDFKTITVDDLNNYLGSIEDLRTRHNNRANIKAMYQWALTKGYTSFMPEYKGTVADGTKKISSKHFKKTPNFYSPDDLKRLFEEAHWTMVPWIIAANYSGIRLAEIARLKWSDVDWEEGAFVLKTEITKTNKRRYAYFPPGVKDGLKEIAMQAETRKMTKLIHGNINKRVKKLREAAGIPYKQNGHRKAYITYAMALTRNANEIAEQCGNSPSEIQSTYKGLAAKTIAEEWFKVIDTPKILAKLY
jgi:integrase